MVVVAATSPMRVGVIGGGIAGLSCARRLTELGLEAVVFDTGKGAPGGRCSSRRWPDDGTIADHAAQYAAATTPSFEAYLRGLEGEGLARRWTGHVGNIEASGQFVEEDSAKYVGAAGMGSVAAALARGVDVRQDVWVPPSGGLQHLGDGGWTLRLPKSAGDAGRFDAVVIAHNGKCAERLTSTLPAREVHALLRTRFAARLPGGGGGGRFCLNSIYSLLVEVRPGAMPESIDGAFVHNHPSLRWIGNNHAKYGGGGGGGGGGAQSHVWTVLSSGEFGAEHKVPQEQLQGTPTEGKVTALLLEAVEQSVGLARGELSGAVLRSRLQLWGAAVPLNRWDSPFVWDSTHRIGIAGDWCSPAAEQPSSLEAAWLSGARLAEHIAAGAKEGGGGGGGGGEDVGATLGADGGRFVPVDGGFGADGADRPSCWVVPLAGEGGSGKEGGRGRGGRGAARGGRAAAQGRGNGAKGGGGGGGGGGAGERLFVKNLPYSADEAELRSFFGAEVAEVTLVRGADGRPRGLARVRMASATAAKAGLALDGKECGGRPLRVQLDEK